MNHTENYGCQSFTFLLHYKQINILYRMYVYCIEMYMHCIYSIHELYIQYIYTIQVFMYTRSIVIHYTE